MATLDNRAPDGVNNTISGENSQPVTMDAPGNEHNISEYELCREQRIRENRERMQKLGIFDLTQKLNALKPTPKRPYHRKTPLTHSPLPPSGPARRSSRLQNSTPVSYCEVAVTKKDNSLNDYDILREEGSRPEVYNEEHEKLLGSTEMSWTLFVDGYGNDGKRIYDPVKGKTCHQCRQKTLGHRTNCSRCEMVQGQFCGDCLYMRYGENVLEAKANPNWICPVCRDICNCSLCRNAKGWPPTGTMYKKISSLGYKSVAHYLIQTRRSKTDSDTKPPNSAKRSLPFTNIELVTPGEDNRSSESLKPDPVPVSNKDFGDQEKAQESRDSSSLNPTKNQLEYPGEDYPSSESLKPDPLSVPKEDSGDQEKAQGNGDRPLLNPLKDKVEYPLKAEPQQYGGGYDKEKEAELLVDESTNIELKTGMDLLKAAGEPSNDPFIEMDRKDVDAVGKTPKSTKKRVRCEPTPDSIAGRLRQRRSNKEADEVEYPLEPETQQNRAGYDKDKEAELLVDDSTSIALKTGTDLLKAAGEPSNDPSIEMDRKDVDAVEKTPKSTKKRVRCEPTPDCIAGRLRQRRNKGALH